MEDRAQESRSADTQSPLDAAVERETDAHGPGAVQSLKQAMRRARYEDAERTGVMAELRAARIGRLEILQDALNPLTAQIPRDVDIFDMGLTPGVNPRLFIDMIGFVEMGRDARVYRFVQDTRHGRVQIAESEDIDVMVAAVTDYVARRLLERDKALASDAMIRPAKTASRRSTARDAPVRREAPRTVEVRRRPEPVRSPFRWGAIGFAFLIDLLGSIAFFLILAGIGWVLWNHFQGQVG